MNTRELFRYDGYLKQCDATVIDIIEGSIILDQTVFYPVGGGQPGDTGSLVRSDGRTTKISDTYKDETSGRFCHVVNVESLLPSVGEKVTLKIDWERRYRLMKMHSCMHMLCAVIPAPVTGGSIQEGRGRLDFDLPDPVDKADITKKLNEVIEIDYPMNISSVKVSELKKQPDIVRTMSVSPPLSGEKVRLIHFEGADLQPCGGTHVASSAEIGKVSVRKVEKKGKKNRRIVVEFDND